MAESEDRGCGRGVERGGKEKETLRESSDPSEGWELRWRLIIS